MKKRLLIILAFAALALLLLGTLSGCGKDVQLVSVELCSDEPISVEVGNFSYDMVRFVATYSDGTTETLPLTADMVAEVEQKKLERVGDQTVRFLYNNILCTFDVKIGYHSFGQVKFEDETVTYDGFPHSLRLTDESIGDAFVSYPNGNTFTDAGVYRITAVLEKENYNPMTLEATLTVLPADYDVSDIVFEDKSAIYTGSAITNEAYNLPLGVTAKYSVFKEDGVTQVPNGAVDIGTYVIRAEFVSDEEGNYNPIPPREAKLTISLGVYDMSLITLQGQTLPYDGKAHPAKLINENLLPVGVTPVYSYYEKETGIALNGVPTRAGNYRVEVTFNSSPNYQPITPYSADFIIEKSVIDTAFLTMNSESFVFDERAVRSLAVNEAIPEGVTVSYEGNGKSAAGRYEVKAKIQPADPDNYAVTVGELTATLLIRAVDDVDFVPSDISYSAENGLSVKAPDGISALLTLTDPETKKEVTDPAYGIQYSYSVSFAYTDPEQNELRLIRSKTGEVTFFDPAWIPGDADVFFDAADHAALFAKPDAIHESWKGEYSYKIVSPTGSELSEAVEVGTYRVLITLTQDGNYAAYQTDYTATLTISMRTYKLPVLRGFEGVYNKDEKRSVSFAEELDGLITRVLTYSVKNVATGETKVYDVIGGDVFEGVTDAGTYEVTLTLRENLFYQFDLSVTAQIIIVPKPYQVPALKQVTPETGDPTLVVLDFTEPLNPEVTEIVGYKVKDKATSEETVYDLTKGDVFDGDLAFGEYTVTVLLKENSNYTFTKEVSIDVSVDVRPYTVPELNGYRGTFNGLPHNVSFASELTVTSIKSYSVKNLANDEVTVYDLTKGQMFFGVVDAGNYEITVTLADNSRYFFEKTVTATVIIEPKAYKIPDFTFFSGTYDGLPHGFTYSPALDPDVTSIEKIRVGTQLSEDVDYVPGVNPFTGVTQPGTYYVTIYLTPNPNYDFFPIIKGNIVIAEESVVVPRLIGYNGVYDGKYHLPTLSEAPQYGVTVTGYAVERVGSAGGEVEFPLPFDGVKDAGTYYVTVLFSKPTTPGIRFPESIRCTVTIAPRDVYLTEFTGFSGKYDGKAKSVTYFDPILKEFLATADLTYTDLSGSGDKWTESTLVNAGTYTVTFNGCSNANFNPRFTTGSALASIVIERASFSIGALDMMKITLEYGPTYYVKDVLAPYLPNGLEYSLMKLDLVLGPDLIPTPQQVPVTQFHDMGTFSSLTLQVTLSDNYICDRSSVTITVIVSHTTIVVTDDMLFTWVKVERNGYTMTPSMPDNLLMYLSFRFEYMSSDLWLFHVNYADNMPQDNWYDFSSLSHINHFYIFSRGERM